MPYAATIDSVLPLYGDNLLNQSVQGIVTVNQGQITAVNYPNHGTNPTLNTEYTISGKYTMDDKPPISFSGRSLTCTNVNPRQFG